MKTAQTHLTDESKAKLFREAFLFQIELEGHLRGWKSVYRDEVKDLIEGIDRLMQVLIDDDHS